MLEKCKQCVLKLKSCNWCLKKSKKVDSLPEKVIKDCKDYRDFPIYEMDDVEKYEKGKLTKEEILEKQKPEDHKYFTKEENDAHNEKIMKAAEKELEEIKEPTIKTEIDYSLLNVTALKTLCRDRGLKGYSKMTKDELITLLGGN